jgi:predicted phage terminase large subunit-like protein
MTRWHEDDLAGRLIENEADVTVINLPLEAEEDDPLGRNIGDALCPEIGKDNKWLESFKKVYTSEKGSRAWNALYQGHPTGLEGNMFKREWWQYYDTLPEIAEWVMSVDAAFKDGEDNDFVAIQVWGKTDANLYLVDAVKKHLNLPDTMREITRLRSLYPMCKTTLIEDKANGSAIINIMRKMMTGIIAVEPKGGKMSRANSIIGVVESGNVYLPKKKPFTGDFVESCAAFPNGKHDDDVDAAVYAISRLVYSKAKLKPAKAADPIAELFPAYKKKSKKKFGRGEKIRVV